MLLLEIFKLQVRVISDLHVDLNKNYPITYNDDAFTIIAGDISGNPNTSVKWIKDNIKQGIFVHGNHLVYNELNLPLQSLTNILSEEFPLTSNVSYLNNQYKIINDIVFIGSCLYTNFGNSMYCQKLSEKGINDFRWGLYQEQDKCVPLTTQHYINMYNVALTFLTDTLEKFKDKKCVVITHYAPTYASISPDYQHDPLNGAFANDLTDFILKHRNIKYWCCGHIHYSKMYMVGGTHVVCNPFGYEFRRENPQFDKNLILEI